MSDAAADDELSIGYRQDRPLIYKYVSDVALRGILNSSRLGFSLPADLNDLFDQPRVERSRFPQSIMTLFGSEKTDEELAQEEDARWGTCAVGSFTRTPDNALMWAHYAAGHRGAVIELDADIAELTAPSLLVPVQYGSCIYMKRPNQSRYGRLRLPTFRKDGEFRLEDYERLQRLFLSKPLSWAYEEEVRAVVRTSDFAFSGRSMDGRWERFELDGRTLWGLRLDPGAVTRVIAGARFEGMDWLRAWGAEHRATIERATPSPDTWDLRFVTT
ncbi:DUF2971 domain-containing protein [Microvirga sp. SRT01]|uniref:DUF2971 domain-containing protein n=1 Tax=Sphingomonas longa TaxID=2778730 RepID=A0ABS2DA83_9SPHN|nr:MULTISPECIES: DUF2971 domain-containing protein [Alphaproteobacteria]MBM6577856.1 DUF2971 domain-containing protein [Sphingomonas sp. BT552]MBR7710897.1 DUF2971 domain-containing protein [Microvirga sp. SRT01]